MCSCICPSHSCPAGEGTVNKEVAGSTSESKVNEKCDNGKVTKDLLIVILFFLLLLLLIGFPFFLVAVLLHKVRKCSKWVARK